MGPSHPTRSPSPFCSLTHARACERACACLCFCARLRSPPALLQQIPPPSLLPRSRPLLLSFSRSLLPSRARALALAFARAVPPLLFPRPVRAHACVRLGV
eukprot:2533709-Pleurochrysis_carterae.AAC.1